ncbi:hypothetical protein AHAS_Ahas15G0029300 [Arachis hypogaea]
MYDIGSSQGPEFYADKSCHSLTRRRRQPPPVGARTPEPFFLAPSCDLCLARRFSLPLSQFLRGLFGYYNVTSSQSNRASPFPLFALRLSFFPLLPNQIIRNGKIHDEANYVFVYTSAVLVLASALYLYILGEKSISIVYYSLLFDIFLVKLLLRKPVKKESVVIMPAFGVQLETHYMSGKIVRCFVPIDKILKPVLVECVTPVTCYWTLSLMIRGESEMVLVFKSLHPPVKMLVHVWKALCAATDIKEEALNTCTTNN